MNLHRAPICCHATARRSPGSHASRFGPAVRGVAAVVLGCGLPLWCAAQSPAPSAAYPGVIGTGTEAAPTTALRLGLSANTQIVYQPRPYLPPNDFQARPLRQQSSLGLEFKAPNKDKQGPRSLLRVQLSGDSVLNFRPRGGGMTVTYKSQF